MIIYKESAALHIKLQKIKLEEKKIGFVPTMGALHNGHISLIADSRKRGNTTVCSIFVNPTQFNDQKDFEKYPIDIEKDIFLLEKAGTDILFLPSVKEMYPEGLTTLYQYDLGFLETILEGYYRPGHFQGVCRIVHKLLNIVQPHHLFMGQKDYQQCMVIKKLISDYSIHTKLNIVETEREENGLAMSSRNLRLSAEAKQKATAVYKALQFIKANLHELSIMQLKEEAIAIIANAGFEKIDYVEICNASTLQPVAMADNNSKLIVLAAAFIESVRLIDNLMLN
jgi:pantoate--beta-alanine ligase